MPIRVVHVAAECEPWAKTGGLGDVVDALARALGRLPGARGAELAAPVEVFLPRYRSVPVPADARRGAPLRLADPRGGPALEAAIVDVAADGYRLRLVDVPAAFDRDGFYDHPDDAWRFAVFARAVLAALRADGPAPDVLHLHDWHAAPVVLERARLDAAGDPFLARTAVQATLHNLAYHGWTPLERVGQLGLAPGDGLLPADADGIDLLRTLIERADLVNTVSPGFAAEARTEAFGMGLDGVLRGLGDRFLGIRNGIDPDVWDPATDAALLAPYGADRVGKGACRADLLARAGLLDQPDAPVLGMIGRLDPQKGFDLLAGAAPRLLAAGARIVVQASGDPAIADAFRALEAAHPGRLRLIERFDREMARRIYAGADLFLMPSRFEPCGTGQMVALRYGTPPVVRRTGGLGDTVVDADERPGEGTGFVFDAATPEALAEACERAIRLRAADPRAFAALQDRAMATDFRWETSSAPAYLAAYRRALALRAGTTRA